MPSRFFFAAITLLFSIGSATAADLSIAIGADVTSIDPHFHNLTPNNNIADYSTNPAFIRAQFFRLAASA